MISERSMETADKLRHVQGGLDHAVEYSEAKRLQDLFIVDIDCHIYEPFASFSEYLPENYRKQYNNIKQMEEAEEYREDYKIFTRDLSGESIDPLKLKLLKMYYETKEYAPTRYFDLTMGGRIKRTEIKKFNPLAGFSREQTVDIFVNRMHDIGIKRSMIFPNMLLNIGNHPDNNFEVAISNAFTDYMVDNFLDKYPQLLSFILVPANSPDRAAELIDRVGSEKGIAGLMITTHRRSLAGDESWLPIYEAARRKNLPICFHASLSWIPPYDKLKSIFPFHSLAFPFNIILQLTSLLSSGIPERFPDLKFVFIEGGVTWIPWIMNRLDSVYMMMRSEAPILKKLPSEYIKQFYFSSQPLEHPQKRSDLEFAFKAFNAETQLMYASDYPHHDFDVPSVIYGLPFLTTEAKKNILGETARKVFRIN
ncbi:MAG: amidohydrolase family protein [Nitrososphaerales archaeon]